MNFPIAFVSDTSVVQVFYSATPFLGLDGVQHPAAAWQFWSEEDWSAMCPGIKRLPVVDPSPSSPLHRYANKHFTEWEVVGEEVRITYEEYALSEAEIAQIEAAMVAERAAAVQRHMDITVQARGYENLNYCVTYAEEPAVPKFQEEGRTARAWRSLVWATCYQLLAEIKAGTREPMTNEELIATLPVIAWPAA